MTLRRAWILTALLALACGSSEPSGPAIATGPAVDAAKGPPGGPKLGTPVAELGGEDLGSTNGHGERYALPDQELFGVTMGVEAAGNNGALSHLVYKAVLPEPGGVDACEAVRDGLTGLYGEPRNAGVPFVMPMDIWQGSQHAVTWTRRQRLEKGGVVCTATFGPALDDEEISGAGGGS